MNEDLEIDADGLELITSFEGPMRTRARLCEGGKYELSYGATTDLNGNPFTADSTCTKEEGLQYFAYHLHEKSEIVRKYVKVPLNRRQFSALVALVYQIGEDHFRKSTVLKMINNVGPNGEAAPRWEDAASAFSKFVYATRTAAQRDPSDPVEWYRSPAGLPCPYQRAYKGTLRRHLAETCLFMSRDWRQACAYDSPLIHIETRRFWNNNELHWEDEVLSRTEFYPDIWDACRTHELLVIEQPSVPASQPAAPPVPAKPTASAAPPAAGAKPQAPLPPIPAAITIPVVTADIGKIRVENGAKVMEQSDRAVAVSLKLVGIGLKTLTERRVVPVVVTSLYFEAVSDPLIVASIIAGVVSLWGVGHALLVSGRRKRAAHAVTATTLTY